MTDMDFHRNGWRLPWLTALFYGLLTASCSRSSPSEMIWIPPGPFIMGTDVQDSEGRGVSFGLTKPWFEDESPARRLELPGFYIDRHEVTNQAYAEFIRKTGSIPPTSWKDGLFADGKDRYPVTDVNWFQADAYCRWAGMRLPTEAEWEKAARGAEGLAYPWGNLFEANRSNLLSPGPQPVGSFPQGASPYGIQDMVGNAWEWTADWYAPYPGNSYPSDNYGKQFKVIRGKSWTEGFGHFPREEAEEILEHEARSSYRLFFDPTYSFGDLGFRCVKDS